MNYFLCTGFSAFESNLLHAKKTKKNVSLQNYCIICIIHVLKLSRLQEGIRAISIAGVLFAPVLEDNQVLISLQRYFCQNCITAMIELSEITSKHDNLLVECIKLS